MFNRKFSNLVAILACTTAGVGFAASSAQAGFGWTPPAQQQYAAPQPQEQAATPAPDVLTPEPEQAAAPLDPVVDAPLQEPVMSEAVPAPLPAPEQVSPLVNTEAIVQGFGDDIPLVLALNQIVPPTYAYKFETASPAQKVSWQGGKPWPQVLSDMLSANNLQVVIVGSTLTLNQANGYNGAAIDQSMAADTETKVARLNEEDKVAVDEADPPQPVAPTNSAEDVTEAQAAEQAEMQAAQGEPMNTQPEPVAEPVAEAKPAAVQSQQSPRVADIDTKRVWKAGPGKTLRETLEEWSKSAGADIEWMSPYDYPVDRPFSFQGRFDQAVNSLLAGYSKESPRPRGRFYPNLPTGPSVLMIN